MGLTEERIKIKVTLEGTYIFKGKKMDGHNQMNLETNIKDDLMQQLFNTVENELQSNGIEDFDMLEEEFEVSFN